MTKNTVVAKAGKWAVTGDLVSMPLCQNKFSEIYDLTNEDIDEIETMMDENTIGTIIIYNEENQCGDDYRN